MAASDSYTEEVFGILTDDDLYLDCILVKPANAGDEDLKVIRVWVPRYPLTKSSVITCARQEVSSYGPDGKVANLVFDLRGTGESDGSASNQNFNLDLEAIADWADERFGPNINFGFFGFPRSKRGRVYMWPLREGTVMESYYYPAAGSTLAPPTVLYLSTYGNFSRSDDLLCTSLADSGYNVYGVDPFRYLLHASAVDKLTADALAQDLQLLIQMLSGDPLILAHPLAAGLALLWASQSDQVTGVTAIGRSQAGFAAEHIFNHENAREFYLPRRVGRIAPRPAALVRLIGHGMGGDKKRMKKLYAALDEPRRLLQKREITADFLETMLEWMQETSPKVGAAPEPVLEE
jgi:pimeloyl-ACP methyl ester carboxylesterase